MTESVKKRLQELLSSDYKQLRNMTPTEDPEDQRKYETLSNMAYYADHFCYTAAQERPILHQGDLFGFYRFCPRFSEKYSTIKGNNVAVDYESVLAHGLNGFRRRMDACEENADAYARNFYHYARLCLDACEDLVNQQRAAAKEAGNQALYQALCRVPMEGARTYHEALVTLKFVHYILRLNKNDHLTFGRFDQYMKPYFEASRSEGATDERLLELTELFFLSINFDSDLYAGFQLGDNGQSIVLGGYNSDGSSAYNDLTEICLLASEELKVIDPKINLRVNKTTPLSVYERGTQLTKQGLGFPQYLNDDVIVPGLIALGYAPKDAWNYAVAACWEPIIPGFAQDIPNLATMVFPEVVRQATVAFLPHCPTFDAFLQKVHELLEQDSLQKMQANLPDITFGLRSDPLFSLFLRPCIEAGRDLSKYGPKYVNFGMHGAGISSAADALEAIHRAVYLDKIVTAEELIRAMEADFVGYEALQKQLLSYPKMGNNEASVDQKAAFLMDVFQQFVNGHPNGCGGVWRAGTGSAHEYHTSANRVGATAEGRNAYQFFGANFSPALTTRLNGPLSTIQSFTKYDLTKIINGGPLTMEFHDTVFRNEEGEKKVAMLVKSFIELGGHQMQLNTVSRQTLLEAQKHPKKYPNLIVRVWGWSGYFCELAQPFQDHVIHRTAFTI